MSEAPIHTTQLSLIQTLAHVYIFFFFFFNDTATTEIYTLSLHDALPISLYGNAYGLITNRDGYGYPTGIEWLSPEHMTVIEDRKSTRLNSSHLVISYAVFCLKKKKPSNADTSPTTYISP